MICQKLCPVCVLRTSNRPWILEIDLCCPDFRAYSMILLICAIVLDVDQS